MHAHGHIHVFVQRFYSIIIIHIWADMDNGIIWDISPYLKGDDLDISEMIPLSRLVLYLSNYNYVQTKMFNSVHIDAFTHLCTALCTCKFFLRGL